MHLEVFRACTEAVAIVHAHPPTAIAWSISHPQLNELPFDSLPEVILAVGKIPIVPYARPSTQNMGDCLKPYLPQSRVMILARHGGLSWGESLIEAYNGMERMEHASQILMSSKVLGRLSKLPPDEVDALKTMRNRSGNRTL